MNKRVQSETPASYIPREDDDAIVARATEIVHARMERGQQMSDPDTAGLYASMKLHGMDREVFGAMFLDTRHRLIAYREMFQGTIDGAEVHPREVVKAALQLNAAAIIVCHNHPSGNPDPSAADRAVTARLKQALALIDVRLLDHFIVGDGPALSMAARGMV